MARPKNMTINGQAVKSVKINGQLWWKKNSISFGIQPDSFTWTEDDYEQGVEYSFQILNSVGVEQKDYRIWYRSGANTGETPDWLNINFEDESNGFFYLDSWPAPGIHELDFSDAAGIYSYPFQIIIGDPNNFYVTLSHSEFLYDAQNGQITPTNGDTSSDNYVATAYNGSFYDYYVEDNEYFTVEIDETSLSGSTLVNYTISPKSAANQLTDGDFIEIPISFGGDAGSVSYNTKISISVSNIEVNNDYMEVSVSDDYSGETQTARVTNGDGPVNLRFYADAQGHNYSRTYFYSMNCMVDGIYDDLEDIIAISDSDYPVNPGEERTKAVDITRGNMTITIEIVLTESGTA